jgi:hypothetical protein
MNVMLSKTTLILQEKITNNCVMYNFNSLICYLELNQKKYQTGYLHTVNFLFKRFKEVTLKNNSSLDLTVDFYELMYYISYK